MAKSNGFLTPCEFPDALGQASSGTRGQTLNRTTITQTAECQHRSLCRPRLPNAICSRFLEQYASVANRLQTASAQ